jgi:adenylate kinase family enzyme
MQGCKRPAKPDYRNTNLMTPEELKRVVVIGTTCSGKTTFSYQLAQLLRVKSIELDAIYRLPNWIPRPRDKFRMLVENAVAADEWIIDGDHSRKLGDIVLSRASTFIWLKYPWHVILYRALRKFKECVINRQVLFTGNYKVFHRNFWRIISILFWVKIRRNNKWYARLLQEYQDKHLQIFVFRTPKEADRFLSRVKKATEGNQA